MNNDGLIKSSFICPVCGQTLFAGEKRYFCPKGHSFDRAKSGYVNLLQNQKSSAKRHGDDRLMVKTRTEFLEKGYYNNLRDRIGELAGKYTGKTVNILDVGCGECFYTRYVADYLENLGKKVTVYGIDISKSALTAAAGRRKDFSLRVGSIYRLPLADNSRDLVLNIFAPHSEKEFRRVLKPGGVYIRAIPLENHLMGLKKAIYDTPYANKVLDFALEGFKIGEVRELKTKIFLDNRQDMDNLFKMTPYYYKTGKREQERFANLDKLETETEFGVIVYKKA